MTRPASRARAVALAILATGTCSTAGETQTYSGRPYTAADFHFMAGMIAHPAQAVLIAGWAPAHGASPDLRALCARIVVGQRDEIAAMQRWLAERHEPVPDADARGQVMPGMDHAVLMPGMLTEEQLARLDSAQGSDFDRLFLTDMIEHHKSEGRRV